MAESTLTADETKKIEQFKLLFDYTKFNIGLYTTLAAAYIALMASEYGERVLAPYTPLVVGAVAALVIAGVAGGTIASSCTRLESFDLKRPIEEQTIFPYKAVNDCSGGWPMSRWIRIEHTAFWVGLGFIIASVAFPSHTKLSLEAPASGSVTLFDWIVQKGESKQLLAEFGFARTMVLCVESGGSVKLALDGGTGPNQEVVLGGKKARECKALYARTVSAQQKTDKHQKGRLAVVLDK
jgi:hypothetical protein